MSSTNLTISKVDLSVVLPSYLEEENLRILLPRIQTVLKSLALSFNIFVIDTEKPMDHTESACHENGAIYVNRQGGNLYGDAVRTAIEEVQSEFTVFMDADGSHAPEFISELVAMKNTSDVVIASRYVSGGVTENSGYLILMSKILNLSYSLILNLKCKDVSNSFKLYRTAYLKELDLNCDHFDIIEEILFKMSRIHRNLRIVEIPFAFKKRMFGETKRNLFVFIVTYILTIIKLRFSYLPFFSKGVTKKSTSSNLKQKS